MTKERKTGVPTLVGIPFDGQSSYLRGAAEAPAKIRAAMSCDATNKWTELGVDLGAVGIFEDAGDLVLPEVATSDGADKKPHVSQEQGEIGHSILDAIEHGSTVYTDGYPAYDHLTAQDYIHATVNHVEEYVRGQVHTQGIDNFWSLLKRTLNGTYVAVEPFHLDRYVTEQVFRYNNRATNDNPLTDEDRFIAVLSQVTGKRLTYAEVTGKVEETPF